MKGLEYPNSAVLTRLWEELEAHVRAAIERTEGGVAAYLKSCNPAWHAVGRVTFHLAENKRNAAYPFAFLATYTHRLSEQGCGSKKPGSPGFVAGSRAAREYRKNCPDPRGFFDVGVGA